MQSDAMVSSCRTGARFAPGSAGGAPLVSRVVERWHQSPLQAFLSQVLPKFRDLASLQSTPTAEHVHRFKEQVMDVMRA